MSSMFEVKIGDWISFTAGGVICHGEVLYMKKQDYGNSISIVTTAGITNQSAILELRRRPTVRASDRAYIVDNDGRGALDR